MKNKKIPHCRKHFRNPIEKLLKEAKLIPLTHKYMTADLAWYRYFNKK